MLEQVLKEALLDKNWRPGKEPIVTSGNRLQEGQLQPRYIILHCIGFEREKALSILTNDTDYSVTAHFFIDQDGECVSLAPLDKIANHCGKSRWKDQENLNPYAIGIELHAPDYAGAISHPDNLDWNKFDEYTEAQLVRLIKLLNYLVKNYSIKKENILYHSDIAPGRKTDPGPTFPGELFARLGFGFWPKTML